MSSLARLRVSARTVRPAMLAGLGPGPSPRRGRVRRRAQARRQARAPRSRPAVPAGVGRALPRSQRLHESPPRFLPPRPAPARRRSSRAARAARAQAWKPGQPRPARGPPPRGTGTAAPPVHGGEGELGRVWGGSSAAGRARQAKAVRSDHVGAGCTRGSVSGCASAAGGRS
jgi:hypothetical protein